MSKGGPIYIDPAGGCEASQLGTGTPDSTKVLTGDGAWTQIGTTTVADGAVTYAKMQDISATDRVIGRASAGAGDPEEIACTAAGRALIDDADATAQRTTLGLGAMATKATVATGDIDNSAVTYAKIQNVSATDKVLGRSTAGAGDTEEIACTAAGRALIDDVDASAQRTTLGLGAVATLASIATTNIDNNAVDDTKLRDGAARSIIGRSANSSGDPADIAGGGSGTVLQDNGTSLAFRALVTGDLPSAAVLDTEANTYTAGAKQTFQNSATTAGANLASSADPSTLAQGDIWVNGSDLKLRGASATQTVERQANKAAANGYASLDSSTLIPTAQNGTGVADSSVFLRGDRTWASPGAASTNIKQTEIDFGATASHGKTFTVIDADVSATSQLIALQAYEAATSKQQDDNEMDPLSLQCAPGTGSFTLYATGLHGRIYGAFKVNYLIG